MNVMAQTDRIGEFVYLDSETESSLLRNGKVFTRRDNSGSDDEWVGVALEKRKIPVHDARAIGGPDRHQLGPNGFELLQHPLDGSGIDFLSNQQVVQRYYPQCQEIIRQVTGAGIVAAFDHNVRSVSGSQSKRRIEGGQQVQPPLHMVHGDYTMTSAPQRLRDLTQPPTGNDTYRFALDQGTSLLDPEMVDHAIRGGRYAIINLWRSIADEPVKTNPLALCDAALVSPEDLVVFEIHYSDRIGENYYAKYSDQHKWFFYPDMTRNEALLITQWDSAGELSRSKGVRADRAGPDGAATFSFHSAFADPSVGGDAPDRWSIEVRCAVLYDR